MEKQYLDALKFILENGSIKDDRTGVGTISYFGMQQRYNLEDGFPAITTKKLAWKACVAELLWMIEGSGNERRLAEITHGTREGVTTIWTPNALSPYWKSKARFEGDLGRVYGVQWRKWRRPFWELSVDQLTSLIDGIMKDPHSRRHIITSWNPGELQDMALPPCHCFAQFYVSKDNKLSCQMYQRSCDMFLGIPFNIASYSLFTHMIAQVCNLQVGEFVHTLGDAHIYLNHIEQVKEQLSRTPYPAPKLWLNPEISNIGDFTMNDIKLIGYKSHEAIKAEMAV
jgi:thymidylate synthase